MEHSIDEILMALMVAGAIEANNSEDGKLTVEIMESSRGFKGSKQAILAILAQEVKRARVDELQRLIGTHNNDPSTVRYDVLTIDRDLLNKRLERLG